MFHRFVLAFALGLAATTAWAAAPAKLSAPDRHFLMEAAQGGLLEVQLGNLVAQKAADAEVKAFGERMVADHGRINQALQTLATEKGVTLPTELTKQHLASYDRLKKLSGAALDRSYLETMVRDHKKDVKEFARVAKVATDPAVRGFAQTNLGTLRDHLKLATELEAKTKGVGGTGQPSK